MNLPTQTTARPLEAPAPALADEGFQGLAIGVVIPAYDVESQIERVIAGIPEYVTTIIVVEDASRDGTRARLRAL
ncbi:MAG: glycosyltransferase, partial [Planctomycetota bacterium]